MTTRTTKKLFYIHSFPFNKEAFLRDEFEFFQKEGFEVKFIDIADLIKKCTFEKNYNDFLKEHVVSFETKKEFAQFLKQEAPHSLLLTDVGLLSKTAWMYLAIFKSGIPYLLFENPTLQRISTKKSIQGGSLFIKKIWQRLSFKKLFQKPIESILYLRAKKNYYAPQIILTSKERLSAEKRALAKADTKIAHIASPDYHKALSITDTLTIDKPFAVFIDQFFIHHPDFVSNYIIHHFTAQEYYGQLNRFLEACAKQLNLKVVIAAHPRRTKEKEKDFDSTFDIYYNATSELIKKSELVLTHFSTAINFAVIFNKPFALINSSLFKGSNINEEILMLAKAFNKQCLELENIDNIGKDEVLHIDKTDYEYYLCTYIKHHKANEKNLKDYVMNVLNA